MFSAQDMKVKMLNRLTRISPGIGQKPKSGLHDAFGLCDLNSQGDETSCRGRISFDEFDDVFEMCSGCDQDVRRRLWMQIAKGDRVPILGDKLGSKIASNNPAEDTVLLKARHSLILQVHVVGSATGTVE
jgi:hypothetical protein